MNVLTVCSGIGAPETAWKNLGFNFIGQSEIEPFPSAVLKHHFPEVPNFGDMTKFKEWDIGSEIFAICGGTPCQSFSVAGERRGVSDPRGNLTLVFVRICEKFKPKWIIWENVTGVLSSNKGRDFGALLGSLSKLGYSFGWRVLDAQNFGVPQRRRRVFLVGYRGEWQYPASVLFESESVSGDTPKSRKTREGLAPTVTCGPPYSRTGNQRVESEALILQKPGKQWPAKIGSTLDAHYGNKFGLENQHALNGASLFWCQDERARRIMPLEAERLQGFPDHFTDVPFKGKPAPDGHRYKALGNSMAVPVLRWIGERILKTERQFADD